MNRPIDITFDSSPEISAQLAQLWPQLQTEVTQELEGEPLLNEFLIPAVLEHSTFNSALSATGQEYPHQAKRSSCSL